MTPPPMTWPTMTQADLSVSLGKMEQRIGALERSSFYEHLMTAGLKEDQDTLANRAMLDRVTIIGLELPNLQSVEMPERIDTIKKKVQDFVDGVMSPGKSKVVFVRHQNRQVRGQRSAVIEARFESVEQATDFRKTFVDQNKQSRSEAAANPGSGTKRTHNVVPVVRLATRVRVEILHSVAELLLKTDHSVEKAYVLQFVPKPVIKIVRKDSARKDNSRTMTFLDAVSWVNDNGLIQQLDLRKAYERAGSSFRGILAQTFVIMN